jgi:hypothetical protein
MGWLSRKFGKQANVAYYTWHAGAWEQTCGRCRELDGTCWLPEKDFRGPPLGDGCTCPGGCRCRQLSVALDEAWGPGNAEWIRKRGGLVSGAQMNKFLSS